MIKKKENGKNSTVLHLMTTIATRHQPFTLSVRTGKKETKLILKMQGDIVRTGNIPSTAAFLQRNFPEVLCTTCFNEAHISFRKEVRDTEIGHLFEHIVLAALCKEETHTTYNGWTEWDWKKEARGTFHISLSVGKDKQEKLKSALRFATNLTSRLLATQTDGWSFQPSEARLIR